MTDGLRQIRALRAVDMAEERFLAMFAVDCVFEDERFLGRLARDLAEAAEADEDDVGGGERSWANN